MTITETILQVLIIGALVAAWFLSCQRPAAALPSSAPPAQQVPADVSLPAARWYTNWRTRYVLDGREVEPEDLKPAEHRCIELKVEGRMVRVAVFVTIREGE